MIELTVQEFKDRINCITRKADLDFVDFRSNIKETFVEDIDEIQELQELLF